MGLFDRKKRDVSSASSSGVRLLDRVRQLALAGDDEGVKELLLQMQADGVAGLATDAFDLGFGLLSDDENPLAAQCVLTVVPMLDSASDDEVLKANLFAGMAFDDLEMTEMSLACYRYAADRGLASAQYLLALSIGYGDESTHYLNMAASQGHEGAVEFIRDNPEIFADSGSGGVGLLDRVRQLALAGDDEGVKELLLQMQADGVDWLATEALDLGVGLWATDDNPLAAQCVLTVVPMLDSASDDEVLEANLFAGMAFDDLEMTEMSVACFRYAADRGLAAAQFMLAMSIDGAESTRYLDMAASQGYERAVEFIRDHPDIIAASGGSQSARSGTGTTGGGVLGSSGGLPGSQEPRLTRASDKDPGLRGGLGRNVGAGAAATEPVGGRDEHMKDEPNAGPGATRSFRSPALELPDA